MITFIETKVFTRLIQEYLTDEEYLGLQQSLIERPKAGSVIRGWKMLKKRDIGAEILSGLRGIKRGHHGRVINVPRVAEIREKTGLSQARFAELLGVSVRTLQDWEQGRRAPSGAARTLLRIAAKNPKAFLEVA